MKEIIISLNLQIFFVIEVRWIGLGVVSKYGERTENRLLEGKPGGRNKMGRPKFRWMIDVKL